MLTCSTAKDYFEEVAVGVILQLLHNQGRVVSNTSRWSASWMPPVDKIAYMHGGHGQMGAGGRESAPAAGWRERWSKHVDFSGIRQNQPRASKSPQ